MSVRASDYLKQNATDILISKYNNYKTNYAPVALFSHSQHIERLHTVPLPSCLMYSSIHNCYYILSRTFHLQRTFSPTHLALVCLMCSSIHSCYYILSRTFHLQRTFSPTHLALVLFNMQFLSTVVTTFFPVPFHFIHSGKHQTSHRSPKRNHLVVSLTFRPISLTPCLAKVLEEFVAEWLINDIKDKIDPKQFWMFKKAPPQNLCPFHNWLSSFGTPLASMSGICYLGL